MQNPFSRRFSLTPIQAENIGTRVASILRRKHLGRMHGRRWKHRALTIEHLDALLMLAGDFDNNGLLDASDIDLLSAQVRANQFVAEFDLNSDGNVDSEDRRHWVEEIKGAVFGDSNFDGTFGFADLELLLDAGRYEDGIANNSGWREGDWDGDGDTTTSDFVFAFTRSVFEIVAPSDLNLVAHLLRDTSPEDTTNSDRLTHESKIVGKITGGADTNPIVKFGIDGGQLVNASVSIDGSFVLDPHFATDGSADGPHSVQVVAANEHGQTAETSVDFTLDTTAPKHATVRLAPDFADSPTSTATHAAIAAIVGNSQDATAVNIRELGIRAASDESTGAFSVNGLQLKLGDNPLTIDSYDRAGNVVQSHFILRRLPKPGAITLSDDGGFVSQISHLIELPPNKATNTLSFDVSANLTNGSAVFGDTLLVYVTMPGIAPDISVDRGQDEASVFSLTADRHELVPGIVQFDGKNVRIDVSALSGSERIEIVFQLVNFNGVADSQVAIENLHLESDSSTDRPIASNQTAELSKIGPELDLSMLASLNGHVIPELSNIRFDSTTGTLTAELLVRNIDRAVGRNIAVAFPGLPESVSVPAASGITDAGAPYFNLSTGIRPGGLDEGKVSASFRMVIRNPDNIPFQIRAEVLGNMNRAPVFDKLPPSYSIRPGEVLQIPLEAFDADDDELSYRIAMTNSLPSGELINGLMTFRPRPGQEGTYPLDFIVTDGIDYAHQYSVLEVNADTLTGQRHFAS